MVVVDSRNDAAVIDAAMMALKTGDMSYIMPWVPEEHENTVRNLFERTVCEQRIATDGQQTAIDWFLSAATRFSGARRSPPFERTGHRR